MIPKHVTGAHIEKAIRLIIRDGVPPGRRSRGYCLATKGEHLPPKYTIALAHQVATGELLPSNRFSGGPESNEFLRRRGFAVIECDCCGRVRNGPGATAPRPTARRAGRSPSSPHSERCHACKIRVGQLLDRIYGACVRNRRFRWRTGLAAYAGTSIDPVLRDVAAVLEGYRGYGVGTFVRSRMLAGCDYWVPDPGFIVEFDESQHFTNLRKLALAVYADGHSLGFAAGRWLELCEQHDARDDDPPFRDEQRAWYDTLRDLVPSTVGLRPTVRLYARDRVWCSLDPDSKEDRSRFSDLIHHAASRDRRTTVEVPHPTARPESSLRAALVFPPIAARATNGVPPNGPGAQQPDVPTADSLAGEAGDFVLFPEGYVSASDRGRAESLRKLATDLNAPLLVGAVDTSVDGTGRAWQVLLRFDPDGSRSQVYAKHSTADAVAFERPDWAPSSALPTFELAGATAGATICHDQYLGLLPRTLAARGARLWVNPSFDNVKDIKWSSILRLRAVENRFFSLCTLHCDVNRPRTHPFGFSPDGTELRARQPGSDTARPLSECCEAGSIYVVDLDMTKVGGPLDWSKIPFARKPKLPRQGKPGKPVCGCPERRAAGRPGRFAPGRHRLRPTGRDRPWTGLRGSRTERTDSGRRRVLSGARSRQAVELYPDHLESLGTASSRFGAPRNPHDGEGDRVLHTRCDFGRRGDPRTRGAGSRVQATRSEGHRSDWRGDRRSRIRLGTGQRVQHGHQASAGGHGKTRIGSLSESRLVVVLGVDLESQPKLCGHSIGTAAGGSRGYGRNSVFPRGTSSSTATASRRPCRACARTNGFPRRTT